jgi:hypothetical protein
MGDTSVTKVNSQFSPQGAMGQKYLASGVPIAVHTYSILEPFTAIEAT